jgi:hypothetical protein
MDLLKFSIIKLIIFITAKFFLRTFGESGASKPSSEEMPQEINDDTYETREER